MLIRYYTVQPFGPFALRLRRKLCSASFQTGKHFFYCFLENVALHQDDILTKLYFFRSFCYSRQLRYLQVRRKLTFEDVTVKVFNKQYVIHSERKIAQYLIKHFTFKYKFEVA